MIRENILNPSLDSRIHELVHKCHHLLIDELDPAQLILENFKCLHPADARIECQEEKALSHHSVRPFVQDDGGHGN